MERDALGRFQLGHKACGHVLTKADRKRGYAAAMMVAAEHSPERYAWLHRVVRSWYRQQAKTADQQRPAKKGKRKCRTSSCKGKGSPTPQA